MKVLILGSGGREHAIAWSFVQSPLLSKLYIAPGNAGMSEIAQCVSIKLDDFSVIKEFCEEQAIDLVMVGPEQPLADGITEYLDKANIKVVGCDSFCANLESSKAFTKVVCDKANIKTAAYEVLYDSDSAIAYLDKHNKYPQVIKADGLAAGKGVIIAENRNEAIVAIKDIFSGQYGQMDKLVIEEFLTGVEASFFAISDGKDFKILSSAGDHKRIGDNDTGPNTGGMGTYSPSPFVTDLVIEDVIENTLRPTFKYLAEQGHPFKGILFAGLMINDKGEPYLIEYNVRFGDPETQSILSRLESDFLEICSSVADTSLGKQEVRFTEQKAITLVLAAKGYPGSYAKGTEIDLSKLDSIEGLNIFHAGTKYEEGKLLANGGRVLGLTALGDDFKEAYDKVYAAAELVEWHDKYYRSDIGAILFKPQAA